MNPPATSRAIKALTEELGDGLSDQVLLGVTGTGTGKTYTMVQIIHKT
ncbi:hypothetical protein [Emcibacter sp.]|nr:hypothetical protein [Emcibacter sp.]